MTNKHVLGAAIAAALLFASSPAPAQTQAPVKAATAKALRCTFTLSTTANWNKEGVPDAAVKPSRLILRFDTINTDEGSAELRSGTVGTGVTAQLAGRTLHFIQSFRTGPLYVTTIFDQETTGGKLKAVHTRHEFLKVPLEGSTSSPEQYVGECEVVN
jgi:hypothetical protein